MSLKQSISVAMESIDFQKSQVFFKELILNVAELRGLPTSNRNAVELSGITKTILHHTGINLDSDYSKEYFNASILPPFMDARSPLMTYLNEGIRVKNSDRPGVDHTLLTDVGSVDLANGRVTGIFTKAMGHLNIGAPLFTVLTDREIAAIILHECGHQFAYFEYMLHTSTLAVNLNYCASEMAKENEKEKRVTVILNTAKQLDIHLDDPEALADAQNPKTALTVIMETYTRRVRSGTGTDFYDYRSWEALADQFATRQGAGRDLAIGLDKIHRAFGVYYDRGGVMDTLCYVMEVLSVSVQIVGSIVNPVVGLVLLAVYGLAMASPFPPEGTYDNPSARLTRVKNELVGALKDTRLPDEMQRSIHKDVEVLNGLIETIGKESGYFDALWRVLTSYRRENYRQIQFQEDLEKLANNDLFLAASKLKTLAVN